MPILNEKDFENAKRDIDDIGKSANERKTVVPRYGEPYKSIPLISDQFQDAINTIVDKGGIPAAAVSVYGGDNQQNVNDFVRLDIDRIYSQKADLSVVNAALQNKADLSYVDAVLSTKAEKQYINDAVANNEQFVNEAISNLSTLATKLYPTLAEGNADIANLEVNQPVQIGEAANGGLYYKATEEATTLTKSEYDPAQVSKQYTLNELAKYLEVFNLKSGWSIAIKDVAQQILFGTDIDGKFNAQGVYVVDELIKTMSRVSNLESIVVVTSNPAKSGIIFTIVDSINQMLMHLDTDFKLYVAGIEVGIDVEMKSKIETLYNLMFPINTFVALGDSLTEGAGSTGGNTYPYYVAQALGRSVSNQGIGGQDAARISARLNGTTVLVTLPNNRIPADTSSVAVTLNIPLLTTSATTASRTRKVTINGISGTLSKDTSNTYTFSRDVAGSVVNVAPNTPMIIDTSDLQNRIALIWMGTNNSFATETDRLAIVNHIDATIAALKPVDKKYLVLSPWKANTNIAGSEIHNQVLEMHKLLASKYKDRFVNVWWDLVCSYDPNNPQDVIDFNNVVTPTSKMADATHPNSNGYQVVAQSVFNKINQLGW